MSKKILIIPAILVIVLLAAAAAVVAVDNGRTVRIAEGITVGGIAVGGLEPAAARTLLNRELVAPLRRTVRVDHDNTRWTLGAREARVETDVDRVVDDAIARSEEGGVLGRTYRRIAGETVTAQLKPEVTFSDRAVVRLVDRVRKAVGRPAKDARMSFTAAGVETAPSRRGLEVRATTLHKAINAALVSPTAERRFVARTRKVEPKVTRASLVRQNPVMLIADRASFTLRVYKRFELAQTYPIAVGKAGNDTPGGVYTIANKAVNPAWSVPNSDWAGALAGRLIPGGAPDNPIKARWLGIVDGVGIHGTSDRGSIGSNASHGCLRMLEEDVIALYPEVPVGAKILIA